MISQTPRSALCFCGITKTFAGYTAVRDISLEVRTGSFVSVVGPSGCGKSTLLNIAADLTASTSETVQVFGEPLIGINSQAGYQACNRGEDAVQHQRLKTTPLVHLGNNNQINHLGPVNGQCTNPLRGSSVATTCRSHVDADSRG
jgi:ABC-type glutathione transport system ATPase component